MVEYAAPFTFTVPNIPFHDDIVISPVGSTPFIVNWAVDPEDPLLVTLTVSLDVQLCPPA